MSSNNHEAIQVQRTIYNRMTPAQKWQEVVKMRALAWDLKCAAVREAHPNWDEAKVQNKVRKIFLYATT